MKRFFTSALVAVIMIIGILGITNPGFRQPYRLFDNTEGKLTHNYFIFPFISNIMVTHCLMAGNILFTKDMLVLH